MPTPDQPFIDELYRFLKGEAEVPAPNSHKHTAPATHLSDDEVIERCRGAKNAPKFASLFYEGDTSAHDHDDSRADMALAAIIAYRTQDPDQIERIMLRSALRRPKWDTSRGGATYLRYTIAKVVDGERPRPRPSIYVRDGDGRRDADEQTPITSVSFAEVQEPKGPRLEVLSGIFPKGWPSIMFGAAGVVKSIKAASLGQAIADPDVETWLGRDVITCPVMYADWELNATEQARRHYQIARGDGRERPPAGMRYMSTYGIPRRQRRHFLNNVLAECVEHGVEVCFFDSLGLALAGDPGEFAAVVDMFEETIAEFAGAGITVIMIAHQRRLQPGEKHQSLGVYGSVFQENLARAHVQIELVGRDRENHTVTTRLRPRKANFGELLEPIEVRTGFSERVITLEVVDLDDTDRAAEETVNARERVLAALRTVDEAGPYELAEICQTLERKTVKNMLSKLRAEGLVEDTGNFEGRCRKVRSVPVPDIYSGDGDGSETDAEDAARETFG